MNEFTPLERRGIYFGALILLIVAFVTRGPAAAQVKVSTYDELVKAINGKQVAEIAGDPSRPGGKTIELLDTITISQTNGGGIRGASNGSLFATQAHGSAVTLVWAGPVGKDMVVIDRALGLQFDRITLDGRGKARNGFKHLDAWWGNAGHSYRDVNVRSVTGAAFEFGNAAGDPNCSDTVFTNCAVFDAKAGVRTLNHQAVNFVWIGGQFNWVQTPFDFVRGGNLSVIGGHFAAIDQILFVGEGGENAGGFSLRDCRFEMSGYSKRYGSWINAPAIGGASIVLDHCQETQAVIRWDWPDNSSAPLFTLGANSKAAVTNYRKRYERPNVAAGGKLVHDGSAFNPTWTGAR